MLFETPDLCKCSPQNVFPDDDLPADFEARRAPYYEALSLPIDADIFIEELRTEMRMALDRAGGSVARRRGADRSVSTADSGWVARLFVCSITHYLKRRSECENGRQPSAPALNWVSKRG